MSVTYLAVLEENVLRFHVTVQNFALMEVQQRQGHLDQPVHNLLFGEVFALRIVVFDFGVNIATITIDHDDVQILLAVDKAVLVSNNI